MSVYRMNEQANEWTLNGSHEQGPRRSFSRHGNGDTGYSGCIAHLAGQPLMQTQVKGIIFILFLQVIHVGRLPMQRKEPELWQKRCQNDSEAGIYLLMYIKGSKLIRSRRQTASFVKVGEGLIHRWYIINHQIQVSLLIPKWHVFWVFGAKFLQVSYPTNCRAVHGARGAWN